MKLDFQHTCPTVDTCIDLTEEKIKESFKDLFEEFFPQYHPEEEKKLIDKYSEELFSNIKDLMEDVRSTNISMREAADDQLDTLNDEKCELEEQIQAKNDEIENLNNKIVDLKDELNFMDFEL